MATFFPNTKVGAIIAVESPYVLPGMIRIGGWAETPISGCLITKFDGSSKVRYTLEYALSGHPFFYIFGGSPLTVTIHGLSVQAMCRNGGMVTGDGIGYALSYFYYYNAWQKGGPVSVGISTTNLEGLLTDFNMQSLDEYPGVVSFSMRFQLKLSLS